MVRKVLITDNRIVFLFFFFFTVEWATAGKGEEDGSTPAYLETGIFETGTTYAHTQLLNMLRITTVLWVQDIKH